MGRISSTFKNKQTSLSFTDSEEKMKKIQRSNFTLQRENIITIPT